MLSDEAFGQALRAQRLKKKWSQETLALEAGADRNYVSLIELGRNSPSLRMVFQLCNALELAPSELLKEAEARLKRGLRHPPSTPPVTPHG